MYGQKSISQSLLDAVNSITQQDIQQEGWKEMMKDVKDKAGPQPNGGSGVKQGTRYGGGKQKDDEREKETERLEKKKTKSESMEFKDRLIESLKGKQKKIDKNHNGKIDAQDFAILRGQKNEETELEEAEATKDLTVDTLAGPKKAPKGFQKDNEHVSAKVPLKTEEKMEHDDAKQDEIEDKAIIKKMVKKSALKNEETLEERDEGKPGKMFKVIAAKAAKEYGSKEAGNRVAGAIRKKVLAKESKRPDTDTVPFVTDEPQSPKERLRSALGKVKTEMKKSW